MRLSYSRFADSTAFSKMIAPIFLSSWCRTSIRSGLSITSTGTFPCSSANKANSCDAKPSTVGSCIGLILRALRYPFADRSLCFLHRLAFAFASANLRGWLWSAGAVMWTARRASACRIPQFFFLSHAIKVFHAGQDAHRTSIKFRWRGGHFWSSGEKEKVPDGFEYAFHSA